MQEALYALTYVGDAKEIYSDTIESLRARLAQPEQRSEQWWRHEVSNAWAEGYEKGRASVKQPEQEPVAWADKYDLDREGHDFWVSRQANVRTGVPLYTAPPQRDWQGLTDAEMNEIVREWQESPDGFWHLSRAIEAKLKDKNEY
jgi:hypothetical protein